MDSRINPTTRRFGRGLLSSVLSISAVGALLLTGCGGQMPFSGKLAVAGDPPALPPPPPPPKPEPPKPKPRVEVRDNKIEITEKIQFDHAKATIKPESHGLLDEIVQVLKDNAHIKKVAIEGHASGEGNAAFNRKLSDDRAKAVRQYLIDHGIAEATLTAKGFGPDKPIASNDTEEGRETNRRVEFNIVEQDVTKKKVEIDPTTGKERVVETKKESVVKPTETDAAQTPAEKAAADKKAAEEKKAADKKAAEEKKAADKKAADEKKK